MQFNGFEVYPCGNAVLSAANGVLNVSGISNSGLDGVNLSSFTITSIQAL